MAVLITELNTLGIRTQSCCERDHLIVDGELIESDHAHVEFADSQSGAEFCRIVGGSLGRRVYKGLPVMIGHGADVSGAWVREAYALPRLGSLWGYSAAPWTDASMGYVGVSVSIVFPRRELAQVTSTIAAYRESVDSVSR